VRADLRAAAARQYYAAARTDVTALPRPVLELLAATLRNHLGQVLAVIDGQAAALTAAQVATVMAALADAAWWRAQQSRKDMAAAYRELAREIGDQQS
jgi:hypothetical protein